MHFQWSLIMLSGERGQGVLTALALRRQKSKRRELGIDT